MRESPTQSHRKSPTSPYSFKKDFGRILTVPPAATLTLVLVTTCAFIEQSLAASNWKQAVGVIPANLSNFSAILQVGETQSIPTWLTLLTYMFLHSGFLHMFGNMAGLWLLGILAEPAMGAKRFIFAYLASGVGAALTIAFVVPQSTTPMVGASGAISGVLGAILAIGVSKSRRSRQTAIVAAEAVVPVLLVVWLFGRSIPLEPDRWSSAVWHLIPLLAGWYGVRLCQGFRSIWDRAPLSRRG